MNQLKRRGLILHVMLLAVFAIRPMTPQAINESNSKVSLYWGLSERQGRRPTMEDAHVYCSFKLGEHRATYFGLFDGHGGQRAADYAADHAAECFIDRFKANQENYDNPVELIKKAHEDSYEQLDKDIQLLYKTDGTTALTALFYGDVLHIAWAGDSRGIVCTDTGTIKLETIDHKPNSIAEWKRIESTGEHIWLGGVCRVGYLSVSRTLGDRESKSIVKQNAIISQPEVLQAPIQEGDIIILACDGVWDVLNNDYVASFVTKKMAKDLTKLQEAYPEVKASISESSIEEAGSDKKLTVVARALRDKAYRRGSTDNISVLLFQVPLTMKEQ